MIYILIGLLIFGILIAVHELGHFMAAKMFGIRVNEFAIGMGPALWKRERGETLYSLRILPIGGYCAMEGEDEESGDPRSFGQAKAWKKIIVLSAGAFMNFVAGVLILLILYSTAQGFRSVVYGGSIPGYGLENCGLLPGDQFLSVDGHKILTPGNVSFYLSRAGDQVDFEVERNGQRVKLPQVSMPYQERTDQEGNLTRLRGIQLDWKVEAPTLWNKIVYSWYTALDYVRLVWITLRDLVTGQVGVKDLSGPVGIVDTMSQVGSQAPTLVDAVYQQLSLAALIAVNLAVLNLLPLPALDGGRIFFLILNEWIFRRRIPARYEGYVHTAGMVLLLALMIFVTINDIGKLFQRF